MDIPAVKTTPKDFFLWAGAMISLYGSVIALITLLFNYINYAFPDPLRYTSDPYSGGMSYQMASLIILVPLFLVLMRTIRASIAADSSRAEVWIRRWALYLTVFVAGATVVVDLIVLLTTFLNGESITTAFLLKVLVVLLVAGGGLLHFLADLRGYWNRNQNRAMTVNWGVGVVVLAAIVSGFFIVGTPQDARMFRLDQQRVNDLSMIQGQIVYFYQQKEELPQNLTELQDPLVGFIVPTDPQTEQPYEYSTSGNLTFQLCATFSRESAATGPGSKPYAVESYAPYGGYADENWNHQGGRTCFERTIDPEKFPPIKARI